MFDWSFYPPPPAPGVSPDVERQRYPLWVPERTMYLTRHGSHAYGTSTPTSDLDIRGICIAPREHYHGFRWAKQPAQFEQIVIKDPDVVVFEIRKMLAMCVEANPNALELLFTDPSDHILVTPMAEELIGHRDLFLTKMTKHAFAGYAAGQLSRMKLHYEWNHGKAPDHPPTRQEYGLSTPPLIKKEQLEAALSSVQKKLDEWNLTGLENLDRPLRIALQDVMAELLAEAQVSTDSLWEGAARMIGLSDNFIDLIGREKRYRAAVKEWHDFQDHRNNRNVVRYGLEVKYGYDTKHGMHLVRLLRMAHEILTTGKMLVRRTDAEELLYIRNGGWTWEQMLSYSEQMNSMLTSLMKVSTLPDKPDLDRVNDICVRLVEIALAT